MLNFYKNNKKGTIYRFCGTRLNCTNAQDGDTMVDYRDHNGARYVREINEFIDKFTPINLTFKQLLKWIFRIGEM